MPVSREYREYVLEQLGRITSVTDRSMFGGVGIYSQGLFFALMANDVLYLKVDDSTRPDFEEVGKGPFQPFGEKPMGYYELPGELLEDTEQLRPWVMNAIEVARRKRSRKR